MARNPPIWRREGFTSRRQYENSRARRAGFENYSQFQRLRKDPAYNRMIAAISDVSGASPSELRKLDSGFNTRVAERGVREMERGLVDAFGIEAIEDTDYDVDWEEFRDFYEEAAA